MIVDVVTDKQLDTFTGAFRETAEALLHYGKESAGDINTTNVY